MMLDVHLWTNTRDVKDALEEGLQTLFLLARSFMKQQSPQASRSAPRAPLSLPYIPELLLNWPSIRLSAH